MGRHRNSVPTTTTANGFATGMIVNLPMQFDLQRMHDLIGFDAKTNRYALFTIHSKSRSLSKLQKYSEQRKRHRSHHRRRRSRSPLYSRSVSRSKFVSMSPSNVKTKDIE